MVSGPPDQSWKTISKHIIYERFVRINTFFENFLQDFYVFVMLRKQQKRTMETVVVLMVLSLFI